MLLFWSATDNVVLYRSCKLQTRTQAVTLSDAKAGKGSKVRLEREGPPTFACLVEVEKPGDFRIRSDLAAAVDAELKNMLSGRSGRVQ